MYFLNNVVSFVNNYKKYENIVYNFQGLVRLNNYEKFEDIIHLYIFTFFVLFLFAYRYPLIFSCITQACYPL